VVEKILVKVTNNLYLFNHYWS